MAHPIVVHDSGIQIPRLKYLSTFEGHSDSLLAPWIFLTAARIATRISILSRGSGMIKKGSHQSCGTSLCNGKGSSWSQRTKGLANQLGYRGQHRADRRFNNFLDAWNCIELFNDFLEAVDVWLQEGT